MATPTVRHLTARPKRSIVSRSDDGYVHDPAAFDESGDRDDDEPSHPATADRDFGWRGWVLVGVMVFAFIISPAMIILWPPDVGYMFALLILPLFPAFFLAVAAVWATTRP